MEDVGATAPETRADPVPICGIGASAGGVQALRSFFRQIPDDLGLAYVVIVHLSPEHPSMMSEILATCTKMPVRQVNDAPQLRPNCVYVIAPDRELVIDGDNVTAREFTEPRGARAPIDMFFRSIAAGRGDGLAVILSGAGADGALGVRAAQEAGGVVFAQDPSEAEFPMMPQNAIATGVVSFIAPISDLVERIAEVSRSKEAVRSLDADVAANDLRRIVSFLHGRTGHDFSSYKRATVMRRVVRRMQVCRVASLAAYAEIVRDTPEEAQELFNDLLISVTMFFRDAPAFEVLAEKVIGPLFDEPPGEGIRAWVAGCATGEEAYSLAIVMLEEAQRRKVQVPIQIFASDLDQGALGTAREGRYPRSIEANVSDERLQRFFIDERTHYRVRTELRDIVLFASHSVLREPPFLRLDLITCRNLLIYLERALQQQLMRLFHYGLRPNACLFLGSAETVDASSDLFATIDREARLYRARAQAVRSLPIIAQASGGHAEPRGGLPHPVMRERSDPSPASVHAAALERTAPPSVLVDAGQQILHMSPTAGRFILHSAGPFSGKLPAVVRPELRLGLKVALDRAFERSLPTMTLATPVALNGERHRVAVHVLPVLVEEHSPSQAIVLFIDGGPIDVDELARLDEDELRPDELRRLYAELKAAQEALVESRGEHDSAIQDLRAANEELQSINEEYRSTSEELETSKEELQSMNEELQTVNAELKSKLESISTAHSDLQNLTAATEIGTLFLDTELRIRMFTPSVADLFNITEGDVGRAITDFTHRLAYDGLERDARSVLRDLAPIETEVKSRDAHWYMMRLRPYRTIENHINGVVLSFVDITGRRETERQLVESEQRYKTLFDSIDEGFCVIEMIYGEGDESLDYRFLDVNAAFERQTGLKNVVGEMMRTLVPAHEAHWYENYGRVAKTRVAERFEAPAAAIGHYYEVYAFPYGRPEDHQVGVLFNDISARKYAEEQREMLTHELSHRVKNTLAVVQALARQPQPGDTLAEYRNRFIGRIHALARAHEQLLQTRWRSADLGALVQDTLSTYGKAGVTAKGEQVELSPKQALGLALIFHELATNAAKYGSLSVERGLLNVSWSIERRGDGDEVRLHWMERDGPPVEEPEEKGFGTQLIERAASYEISGEAELCYDRRGFQCEISFPLRTGDASAESPTAQI